MNTEEFIRLNIVFKPPREVIEKAIALSHELAQGNEPLFILDGINFHPHITIYSPEYPKSNINKVLGAVEEIANNTKKTELDLKQIKSDDGYIGIHFEKSPKIKNLHEEIVTKLNPLRGAHLRERLQEALDCYKQDFSPEQLESIRKYGYPDVLDLYKPHLTIIRLADNYLAERVANKLNWKINHFTVDALAIYTMGENGTCKELVKEFTLK